jgi:hypothetical protein
MLFCESEKLINTLLRNGTPPVGCLTVLGVQHSRCGQEHPHLVRETLLQTTQGETHARMGGWHGPRGVREERGALRHFLCMTHTHTHTHTPALKGVKVAMNDE